MKTHRKLIANIFVIGLFAQSYTAIANDNYTSTSIEQQSLSEAELAQMLAPIALYPDTLLTHILIAATYPIEVVEADRFLKENKYASRQSIARDAQDKDWDPSVKALLAFPQIIEKLSEDLTWMRELGDAFLQDEALVLASIQWLRKQADQAGHLANMDNVQIIREQKTIVIQPQTPEVIYVPYYDTRSIFGHWHWPHRPPIYWHRPIHYSYHNGPYYWRSGVHLALDFFFVGFHWHNRQVIHHTPRYYRTYHRNQKITTNHRVKRWHHNPKHRKGVAYRSHAVKKRVVSHYATKGVKKNFQTKQHIVPKHVRAKQVTKSIRQKSSPNVERGSLKTKHQVVTQKLRNKRIERVDNHREQAKVVQKSARNALPSYKMPKQVEKRALAKERHYRNSAVKLEQPKRVNAAVNTRTTTPKVKNHQYKQSKVMNKNSSARGGHTGQNKNYERVAKSANRKYAVVSSSRKVKQRND